jgi:hypothetical protein
MTPRVPPASARICVRAAAVARSWSYPGRSVSRTSPHSTSSRFDLTSLLPAPKAGSPAGTVEERNGSRVRCVNPVSTPLTMLISPVLPPTDPSTPSMSVTQRSPSPTRPGPARSRCHGAYPGLCQGGRTHFESGSATGNIGPPQARQRGFDGAGEHGGGPCTTALAAHRIRHPRFPARSPNHNAAAERFHGTILQRMLTPSLPPATIHQPPTPPSCRRRLADHLQPPAPRPQHLHARPNPPSNPHQPHQLPGIMTLNHRAQSPQPPARKH